MVLIIYSQTTRGLGASLLGLVSHETLNSKVKNAASERISTNCIETEKKLVFQPNEFCQPFHFPDCFSLFSRYSLFPTAPLGRRKVQKLERVQ